MIRFEGDPDEMTDFTPAPVGEYVLKVLEAEEGTTAKNKYDKISLVVEIDEGPHAGKRIWHTLTFIPKGAPGHGFTLMALKGFGLPYEGKMTLSAGDFEGLCFRAAIAIEPYEDKDGDEKQKNVIDHFIYEDDGAQKSRPAQPEGKKRRRPISKKFLSEHLDLSPRVSIRGAW